MNTVVNSGPVPWQKYRRALTRDLCWLFYAPSLIDQLGEYETFKVPGSKENLDELLNDIEENLPADGPARTQFSRLGLYYEALIQFSLRLGARKKFEDLQILGSRIQVLDGKRTQGELDFLLRRKNVFVHLECAIKFYLCNTSQSTSWENWIGPNARDRLDIKLQHMLEHQLPMGKQALKSQELVLLKNNLFTSEHLIQGRLFFKNKLTIPKGICQQTPTGRWLFLADFRKELRSSKDYYLALEKTAWLSGYHPDEMTQRIVSGPALLALPWANKEKVRPSLPFKRDNSLKRKKLQARSGNSPVFIPGLFQVFSKRDDTLYEKEFVMVVEDHWPDETNSPSRKI